ncbi:SGNH/GDSL hydrolase family protein [Solihabitans fulvus]|uniref:SGNH/GDSL hydrolase family protein n=1 Tax=Solihabitans fulvus TaxID=1892852 RepID=A0A5B2WUA7_9PSEU|nr:SGNH/GDSL hydrolase family protein [Solihabitans fulvus]KAA2254312.1 SGNH/GDSL hydrolase family protein [Solihabitans fulvus]
MTGSGTVAHRPLAVVSALVVLLGLLLIGNGPADAATGYHRYVALGDSYASGPFIPDQVGTPFGCFRSNHNYPSLVARGLGVGSFTDISCGGAATPDMTGSQSVLFGSNPPQFSALRPDTDLVTVSIGGNDIGFGGILLTCGSESLLNPFGSPCANHYGDQLSQRIAATAPKVGAVLAGIHQRAPRARVVLVGYLRILPPSGGCWPVVPISRGDVPYLDSVEQQLNGMLAQQAAGHGATFVNPYAVSLGHDVCQAPWTKWVEGIVPTSPAFPVHPNATGMNVVANQVLAGLGATARTAQPSGTS